MTKELANELAKSGYTALAEQVRATLSKPPKEELAASLLHSEFGDLDVKVDKALATAMKLYKGNVAKRYMDDPSAEVKKQLNSLSKAFADGSNTALIFNYLNSVMDSMSFQANAFRDAAAGKQIILKNTMMDMKKSMAWAKKNADTLNKAASEIFFFIRQNRGRVKHFEQQSGH
jgi:hypothetical protein